MGVKEREGGSRRKGRGKRGENGRGWKGKDKQPAVATFCCGSHAISSEYCNNLIKFRGVVGVVYMEREGRARCTCKYLWFQF